VNQPPHSEGGPMRYPVPPEPAGEPIGQPFDSDKEQPHT
jgi:hypothetical protein